MKRTLIASLVTLGITSASFSATAGLTLCSQHYAHKIDVFCGGVKSPAPIPASGSSTACASLFGTTDLPWLSIRTIIFGGKTTATCIFKNGSLALGSAVLTIKGNSGELTNLQYNPTQLNVQITPNTDQFFSEIKVLISTDLH